MAEGKTTERRARGDLVEAAARAALRREGLCDVAANVSYRGGELDLVMIDRSGREGEVLVFVEVRYRRSAAFGGGAVSIDAAKRRKLVHAAQRFLATHRQYAQATCRFDVVEADGDPHAPRVNWIRDAFRADGS